jgi:hypothetical protein
MQKIMKKLSLIFILIGITIFTVTCSKDGASSASADAASAGQNGSLTRFIVVNNYLYTISNDALKVYNITSPSTPIYKSIQQVGFAIQTIFPYQDKLFIGSNNAMFIYSLANPEVPTKLAEVPYFVRGRDPIVAIDSIAYSTVRNEFGGGGVLNTFNIKNINQPFNVRTIIMSSPYGLGLKDSALYVCEADSGLKVFNIVKPFVPALKRHIKFNETAYDVIVKANILVCYIKGGVALFDITNVHSPVLISTVKN